MMGSKAIVPPILSILSVPVNSGERLLCRLF
jgi:hypothetical protein